MPSETTYSMSTEFAVAAPPVNGKGGTVVAKEEDKELLPITGDYGADAGLGLDGVDASDFAIQWMRIIHYQCPETTEGDARYLPDAKPGMLLNSATLQVVDGKTGGIFVPVTREHKYLEYIPRDAGGGFQGSWDLTDPRIADLRRNQGQFGRLLLENGNELTETFSFFGLFLPDETDVWRVGISFSSTQIRKYRMLTGRLASLIGTPPKYPTFAWRWRVSSQPESNKKGRYFGWRILQEGDKPLAVTDDIYLEAREFHRQLRSGAVQMNYAQQRDDGSAMSDGGAPIDDNIPF